MSTQGAGSVAADGRKKRWAQFRGGAAVVIIGLYIVALTRLAVSEDWGDLTASRLFGLTGVVAGLLGLISLGQEMGVAVGPRRRRSKSRMAVALLVAALAPAGIITSIIRTGTVFTDPVGQLLMQTAAIGTLLIFVTEKPSRDRS
ncbi:hypothetical protein [Nocardia sp. CS682]|uniref:hypothetical protein n=1 Tax=Nocardia sp. CS682 TaxID=1047172 RepID=UPI001075218B|nr:hypothetical protein [Nocardia sp. CS682]QBS44377.1 hypothetical protein DMB37_34135 [Nocardia sp. CS682]